MKTTIVPCASGNNSFAECRVEMRGDLIHFSGPTEMSFAPADAVRLARILWHWAVPMEAEPPEFQADRAAIPDPAEVSPLMQAVIRRLAILFPIGTTWEWDREDQDPEALASAARDMCLSLAVALEQQRQIAERRNDDGR